MKLDIFNIEDFIKVNHLKEVTSPIGLTSTKMPNPDGIYSYDIFGYTTEDRKNTFAYVDLRGNYFHPQVLKTLSRMGSLGKVASGEKKAIIINRKIHVLSNDELQKYPDAETGVDFFYNNWDNINWNTLSILSTDKTDEDDLSIDKKTRLKLLKYLKKNEAFVKYWLILPPYYRDFNSEDSTMGDDINKVYKELILKTMSLKKGFADDFGFSSVGNITKNRIQDLLCILYDISLGPITGKSVDINTRELKGNIKRSLIRRNVLGRFIDYSASSVITSPVSSATETVEEFNKFGDVTLPLQTFMAMYKPFLINEVYEIFEDRINELKEYYKGVIKSIDSNQWSVSEIDKMITRFIKSASDKSSPVYFNAKNLDNENVKLVMTITISNDGKNFITRPLTYLDLFYICSYDVAKDKYSFNTRHPMANNQNIYPAKIIVNSTCKTYTAYLKNAGSAGMRESGTGDIIKLPKYPYVDWDLSDLKGIVIDDDVKLVNDEKKSPIYYEMFRATIIGNGCIKSLNADYDGDMLFFRGLFTKEANAEAAEMVWKKTNWFNAEGKLSRGITKISKDCTMALYALTR